MEELDFIKLCRQKIAEYYHLKEYKPEDIYVVWLCRILQNNKALLSTNKPYKRINNYEIRLEG